MRTEAKPLPYPVTFWPYGKTARVDAGSSLLEAAARAGFTLETSCGGNGTCGKCRVRIRSGHADSSGSSHCLSANELADGWRLACATPVVEALEIELPATSFQQHLDTILTDSDTRACPHDVRPAGTFGVAFDLGTTSVAGALFDLHTGAERAVRAAINQQAALGDDVISRIAAVRSDARNLAALQRAAAATLNTILQELCAACQLPSDAVREIIVAGNTTMQQLLLGLDPSPLGEFPFTPAFTDTRTVRAADLGLHTHTDASLTVLPQIGGFVGGDTVAGMLAAQFDTLPTPALLVDVGTNGEIALLHNGRVMAASAAAGPAFEGARISQGMRASIGAIDAVTFHNGTLETHVIGEAAATGLCGSALVDAVAELLRTGVIDASGAFKDGDRFPLTSTVWLTQRDIRELQLASGAIRAGIETLLHHAGLKASDLGALFLAGGFGNTLNIANAVRIGLLPALGRGVARFVGNAALAGAKRALLSRDELAKAQRLRDCTEHIELSSEPGYTDCFTEHMMFPESECAEL